MKKRVVKIIGDGSVGGGTFDEVKIIGHGRVASAVEADDVLVIGRAEFAAVKADHISITGNANIHGDFDGQTFKLSGTVAVQGDLRAREIVSNGDLQAKTITAHRFFSRGPVKARSLQADDARITIYGRSEIGDIAAKTLEVANKGVWKMLQNLVGGPSHVLEAEHIEAERVYLERTAARTVKGQNVHIGPGCHIDVVEFVDSVFINPEARVRQTTQRSRHG